MLIQLPRRAGWNHLFEAAASPVSTLRTAALTRSYAWIEHALDAANVPGPRKRPTVARILSTFSHDGAVVGFDGDEVERAIRMRHRSGHDDDIPPPAECAAPVRTLRNVWHWLSRQFVSMTSAVELGQQIAGKPNVQAVCLFGSLARSWPDPNDVDLLILDDSTYSDSIELSIYTQGSFDAVKQTKHALQLLELGTPTLRRCAQCRWLDVLIVDGSRLGADRAYTSDLRLAQPDPWFFLNVARDLKELAVIQGEYLDCQRFPFDRLKQVHQDLGTLGFA